MTVKDLKEKLEKLVEEGKGEYKIRDVFIRPPDSRNQIRIDDQYKEVWILP